MSNLSLGQIVEPGHYDYHLVVMFPSVYIPDHTPPNLRGRAAVPTIRTRNAWNQFNLTAPATYEAILDYFMQRTAEELMIPVSQVEFVSFELKDSEDDQKQSV